MLGLMLAHNWSSRLLAWPWHPGPAPWVHPSRLPLSIYAALPSPRAACCSFRCLFLPRHVTLLKCKLCLLTPSTLNKL